MQDYQARVQTVLDTALSNANVPPRLQQAMRYSTLSAGKRARAMLVYAAGEAMSVPIAKLDPIAAALECIHAYSLIHDDLPAMDNDELRRGLATNHIEFDEATAILAGDALQTLAFELINGPDSALSNAQCRIISHTLSVSAGAQGMVGGQILDILATKQAGKLPSDQQHNLSLAQMEDMHQRKTGALISAAVLCGAYASDALSPAQQQAFEHYAAAIGLAFQVVDDVLDIESTTEQLGKTSGADQALGKSTYPAMIGLAESKKLAEKLYHEAIASLSAISDNTSLLKDLAELIVRRKN